MAALDKPAEAPLCPDCANPLEWGEWQWGDPAKPVWAWWCRTKHCPHVSPIDGAAPAPAAKGDRREELKAKIMETVGSYPSGGDGILDVDVAPLVGVLDRAALRALLAEGAIEGKLTVEAVDRAPPPWWWLDGTKPWRVTLAPAGTPSLEDRIVAALAAAGIDGLDEESLGGELAQPFGELFEDASFTLMFFEVQERALASLVRRGTIRDGGMYGQHTLSPAEWARRIADDLITRGLVDSDKLFSHVRDRVEGLLAGTASEPAVTPAAPAPVAILDGAHVEGRRAFDGQFGFVRQTNTLVWTVVGMIHGELLWEGDRASLELDWVPVSAPTVTPPSSTLRTGEAPRGV